MSVSELRIVVGRVVCCLLAAVSVAIQCNSCRSGDRVNWAQHTIAELGHCNTAVSLDANSDGSPDVVFCAQGAVRLRLAPDWKREIILHRFERANQNCIHSAVLDVDRDGDLDWAGAIANQNPFWLENPGPETAITGAWASGIIDEQITGIHCLTAADIDNDGFEDLVVNNFEPQKGLGDSIAWLRPQSPVDPGTAWDRHVFAKGDARGGSHYMGVGDINGDGWKEIAVGAKGGPFEDGNWFAYWIHPGQRGQGEPWKKVTLARSQIAATNILPADVNGDGKVDWVASRGHGQGIIWFENPTWKIHTIDAQIRYPHSLVVADIDQDGDVDAATCGYGSERVMWYENNGKGRFQLHTIDDAQQSYDLRAVDMDNDGDLDLLNAGRGSGNVCWYENPLR